MTLAPDAIVLQFGAELDMSGEIVVTTADSSSER
jgi:hypothetical protein